MFIDQFSLKPVERPGGFNDVNATGANFRRIIDFADLDKTMATNAPGESGQPGSPYYGNAREKLADGSSCGAGIIRQSPHEINPRAPSQNSFPRASQAREETSLYQVSINAARSLVLQEHLTTRRVAPRSQTAES